MHFHECMLMFLVNSNVKTVIPVSFSSMYSVLGDTTLLWDYENMRAEISSITQAFINDTRNNGFDGYYWNRYYTQLLEAGLEEYTEFMQQRLN